ncbi:MAG: NAD(P)H-quinone oxidoreductase, partial [Vulcanimicrobiaceae bacterium]
MRAVVFDAPGSADVLHVGEIAVPHPDARDVLVAVEAAGVSRADVMQRNGHYPPPRGASPILGLEIAGTVAAVGTLVTRWKPGDAVCALTNGGGYAEYVAVPAGQVLPIPDRWSAIEAATLPENAFTVYDNLVTRARLRRGEVVLVHGGTSGIGSTAIMFARALGATPVATVGTSEKQAAALRFGAADAIDYRTADFVEAVRAFTHGRGADVVLDIVGGPYIARDLEALALDGRVVCLSTAQGSRVDLDLRALFAKRAAIMASSLRPRTAAQKAGIARRLERQIWPLLPKRDPI